MTFETILLSLITLIGATYDWKVRRIPNWLTFGGLAIALVFNTFHLGVEGFINSLLGFICGIGLLLIPYLLGGMGAGDVKLLGTVGAIAGYKEVVIIFFYTAISGLIIGIIWLIFTPNRLKFLITTGQILPTVDKKQKVPYGIAILMGTILYIMFGENNIFNIITWQ